MRVSFYLTKDENEKLENISKELKISKSGIFRKVLNHYNLLNFIQSIDNFNYETLSIIKETNRIGININQILKYLNLAIEINNEDLHKLLIENKKIIQQHQELIMNLNSNIIKKIHITKPKKRKK